MPRDLLHARSTRLRVAALAIGVTLVAVGCGSSSPKANPGGPVGPSVTTLSTGTTAASTSTTSAPGSTAGSTTTPTTAATGTSGTTLAAFDAAANAVCKKYSNLEAKVPSPDIGGSTTPTAAQMQQAAAALSQVVALAQQETVDLRAVPRPAAESAKILAAIKANLDPVPAVTTAIAELKAGNFAAAESTLDKVDSTNIDKQFDALGLKTCGSESG
jgi:hypothetical protein